MFDGCKTSPVHFLSAPRRPRSPLMPLLMGELAALAFTRISSISCIVGRLVMRPTCSKSLPRFTNVRQGAASASQRT